AADQNNARRVTPGIVPSIGIVLSMLPLRGEATGNRLAPPVAQGARFGVFLPGYLLALFARLGKADGDGLLAALDLATLAAAAALGGAFLVAAHLVLDVVLRALRISALLRLPCHVDLLETAGLPQRGLTFRAHAMFPCRGEPGVLS